MELQTLRSMKRLDERFLYDNSPVTFADFREWVPLMSEPSGPWNFFKSENTAIGEEITDETIGIPPGHWTLAAQNGDLVQFKLESQSHRLRVPTISFTPSSTEDYISRSRQRDGRCLVTGRQSLSFSRLKAGHIFPRTHIKEFCSSLSIYSTFYLTNSQWIEKGFRDLIIDPFEEKYIGGSSKIDSIQNIITLESGIHDVFYGYEIGISPRNNYFFTSFVNGNDDIHGKRLNLDHIEDSRLRPLDELLLDHFLQGLLKHVKGAGAALELDDPDYSYVDDIRYAEAYLSHEKWVSLSGKDALEHTLEDRLLTHRAMQDLNSYLSLTLHLANYLSKRILA